MGKKKIEQTLQFITIDMDTWNRFCRCIMDFNKYVDSGSPESSSIKKILKKHDLRFKAGDDNEET